MARAPGAGDLLLQGRESHMPRYRSVMLVSEDALCGADCAFRRL